MKVWVVSETASRIVLGHDPVPGAVGFRLRSSLTYPKWSHTWDGTRTQHTFPAGQGPYEIEALLRGSHGTYPEAPGVVVRGATQGSVEGPAGSWPSGMVNRT